MIHYYLIVAVYFSSWGPALHRTTLYETKQACEEAAKAVRVEMPRNAASDSAGIVVIQCVPRQETK